MRAVIASCAVGALGTATSATALPSGDVQRGVPPAVSTNLNIDGGHTGHSTTSLRPPLHRAWTREFGGTFAPSLLWYPLVAGNRVFITAQGDDGATTVYALRARSGRTVWSRTFPDYSGAWLAMGRTTLYALERTGMLTAMRRDTGAVRWRRKLATERSYSFSRPPTVAGGSVYLTASGHEGEVIAVSSAGRVRWRTPTVGGDCTPAVLDGRVFVSLPGPHVYALSARTGGVLWHRGGFPHGGGWSPVAAYRDRVYAGHPPWLVLNAPSGRTVDTLTSETFVAVHGKHLVTVVAGEVKALRREDLVQRWSRRLADAPGDISPPVLTRGLVYVTTTDGMVRALGLRRGREVWHARFAPQEAEPTGGTIAFGGDHMVVATNGWLTAYVD